VRAALHRRDAGFVNGRADGGFGGVAAVVCIRRDSWADVPTKVWLSGAEERRGRCDLTARSRSRLTQGIGQYPVLDGPAKWLLQHVLPLMGRYDLLIKFVNVSRWADRSCRALLLGLVVSDLVSQMCEEEITRYDDSQKTAARPDFLSLLREREAKLAATTNPQGDARKEILNHLSNSLSVFVRTIG
jgi:hypothetical protein